MTIKNQLSKREINRYSEKLEKSFEPEFQERGNSIRLTERWFGSSSNGFITWTITVPAGTEIDFSTASGDLSISETNNMFKANTASGEITVDNSKGEFDFNTASGNISFEKVNGEIDLSTASGDIEAYDIQGEPHNKISVYILPLIFTIIIGPIMYVWARRFVKNQNLERVL